MRLSRDELKSLMKNKLMAAGLHEDQAEETSEILVWSDERGYHSHGSVRVEYYSERIFKGGITVDPKMEWKTDRTKYRNLRGRQRYRICRCEAFHGTCHRDG